RRFMAESAGLESLAAATVEVWKEALNWFFREARAHRAPALHGVPTLGHADLGETDWERRLIARLRELHYAWRTEEYEEDRKAERPGVWMPEALERKYPKAGETWEWHWLFPSRQLMVDPRSGLKRRHHVLDATFQQAIRLGTR